MSSGATSDGERSGCVTWEVMEGFGILTLSDPPHNYLPLPEFVPVDTLRGWMEGEDGSPAVSGLVIRGQGRHFCAGADRDVLFAAAAGPEKLRGMIEKGRHLLEYIENLPVPVLASIRGACFGGGLELALAAHIVVCAENAMFAFPETGLGLMPGLGGTLRMPLLAGKGRSLPLILCGRTIGAREAEGLGIVDRVVSKGEEFRAAISLLKDLTHHRPPAVVRSVVTAINNAFRLAPDAAASEETRLFVALAHAEYLRRRSGKTPAGEEHGGSSE